MDSAYQPFRLQNQYCDRETGCITTSSGITSLRRAVCESGSDWVVGWGESVQVCTEYAKLGRLFRIIHIRTITDGRNWPI